MTSEFYDADDADDYHVPKHNTYPVDLLATGIRDITANDVVYKSEDNKTKFSPTKAAQAAVSCYKTILCENEVWYFDRPSGIYKPGAIFHIKQEMEEMVSKYFTIHLGNEMEEKIKLRSRSIDTFNPDPYKFPVANGIIDLKTGKLIPYKGDGSELINIKSPVIYDENAKCPNIDAFLRNITEGEESVETIKDAFVSAMLGKALRAIYIWIGRGRNGKGVLSHLFEEFFGENQIGSTDIEQLDRDKFATSIIYNKRIVYASETQGSTTKTRKLKTISGGDLTGIEFKYRKPFMYRPYCTIIMDSNDPPKFNDESPGWRERLRPVIFPYHFVGNPQQPMEKLDDPNIIDRITTPSELSGFLNVLVELAKEFVANGCQLKRVSSIDDDAALYDERSHTISSFFDRFCEYDSNIRPDIGNADRSFAATEFLYIFYNRYCELLSVAPKNQRSFTKYITSELGLSKGRIRDCINPITGELDGTARRGFYGINFSFVKFKKFDSAVALYPMQNLETVQNEWETRKTANSTTCTG